MAGRREPDDDVEAEVEARYQARRELVDAWNRRGKDPRMWGTPKSTIRKQVLQERRDEQGAPLLEQVLASAARRAEAPQEKVKPGVKPTKVPAPTRRKVAQLRLDGESPAEIMRQTGLTKTIATRLVREIDDAIGRIRAGRY